MSDIPHNHSRTLLTIAIPTYNGERTLNRALDAIINQYEPDVDILISDNHSSDGTSKIVAEYVASHPFIRTVRNDRNIGPDANFLQCLRMAEGRFVLLLSDDDVLIEGALGAILSFLKKYPNSSLIALNTVSFRNEYRGLENCKVLNDHFEDDVCTHDKVRFMASAGRNWGFLSSFILSTARFSEIKEPERHFDTNWLQSYMHILCSNRDDDLLGLVGAPCIAAGVYGNVVSLDVAQVDSVNYRAMLDFAIENGGYDRRQLDRLFVKRIGLLGRHTIIKERASGIRNMNQHTLFQVTRRYPILWLTLYPTLCVPPFVCRAAMHRYNQRKGYSNNIIVNRVED